MNHELAKTLTTALVQWIDRERSEGTMCCSNIECGALEEAFKSDNLDDVEAFIQKKLSRLTEFQNAVRVMIIEALTTHIKDGNGREMSCTVSINDDTAILLSAGLLELAKKELLSYADESNPAIEAMADLERTFECNPNKLPGWLKDELTKRYLEGYIKGRNDALREMSDYMESHFNTQSGTSTATLHDNTSVTDGKPHNPSFTD